ncbi:zinc metalloproteinase nas-14-like [Hydractinia symbiolongicarpus]|uniref:zinc metalloproteinase nas-14-like n=1 Tax=Hydractinia symbiolongicarpus TaxID=13093 RepID=UPI00254B96BA|nr:zinc metalloproteinase nas-14-like [Hydractinia symbiolongicarpus]
MISSSYVITTTEFTGHPPDFGIVKSNRQFLVNHGAYTLNIKALPGNLEFQSNKIRVGNQVCFNCQGGHTRTVEAVGSTMVWSYLLVMMLCVLARKYNEAATPTFIPYKTFSTATLLRLSFRFSLSKLTADWSGMFYTFCIPIPSNFKTHVVESAMKEILRVNDKAQPENIYFGDEKYTKDRVASHNAMLLSRKSRRKRALVKYPGWRWPNGIVPYVISNDFSQTTKDIIKKSMQDIETVASCIHFVEHSEGFQPIDHVYIYSGRGCSSYIGRTTGRQEISLQNPGCTGSTAIPTHELLHALGFFHEQAREDRDQHVRINWENIRTGFKSNFEKESEFTIHDGLGVPYDVKSIMHYPRYAFSTGGPTIESIANPDEELGGSVLTYSDIKQLNLYYQCKQVQSTVASKKSTSLTKSAKATTDPTTITTDPRTTTTEPTTITTDPRTTTTEPTTITTDPRTTTTEPTTITTDPRTTTTEPTTITTDPRTTTTEPTTITTDPRPTTTEPTTTTTESTKTTTESTTTTTEPTTTTIEPTKTTTESTTIKPTRTATKTTTTTTEPTTTTTESTTTKPTSTTTESTTTTTEPSTTINKSTTLIITAVATTIKTTTPVPPLTTTCEDKMNWCSPILKEMYCSIETYSTACPKSCGCK